jgi:uncharacterized membrane protein
MSETQVEWSATDVMGQGWEKLKSDFGGILGPLFVVGLIQGIPNGIFGAVANNFQADGEPGLASGVRFVSWLVGLVLSAFFTGGTMSLLLKAVRGQPYAFGDIFSGGKWFGGMLVMLFVIQVASGIGFMLCIIPGVIIALGLSFAVPIMVDRDLPAIDALKESWRMTDGHKGNLFVFGLLAFCVMLLGLAACCIGVLPAGAVVALAQVYIYERLRGAGPIAPSVF